MMAASHFPHGRDGDCRGDRRPDACRGDRPRPGLDEHAPARRGALGAAVRPGRPGGRRDAAAALGVCSGLLTLAFFEAIARIPLGVAVTIEFLGPLGVALAGSRRPRDVAWVVLAGAGVAMLTLGHEIGR